MLAAVAWYGAANCLEVSASHQFVWFQKSSQHPTFAESVKN
jgi:hypothetical protein